MGLLYSFAKAGVGGGAQFSDLIEPVVPLRISQATTSAGPTANAVYLYRFRVAKPITVTKGLVWLGATVAGNGAVGIYTFDGTNYNKVSASPDAAWANANAVSTLTLSPAYTLVPGVDYWVAFGATDATLTVLREVSMVNTAIGAIGNVALIKTNVYSSGLPNQITSPAGTNVPFVIALTT